MSATDELRRMLDERGVEWETDRSGFRVMWGEPVDEFHDTMQFKAMDNALPNGGLNVHICGFTPAQAIAATLGSEPPYDELLRCLENDWHIRASWDGLRKFWCIELTEEGVRIRDDGTCEMVTSGTACKGNTDKKCTACGAYGIGEHYDGDEHIAAPKFCPECGAKVVSE